MFVGKLIICINLILDTLFVVEIVITLVNIEHNLHEFIMNHIKK